MDEDRELFNSALTDAPAEQPVESSQEPVQEPSGQPRDDHGRFAPKQPEEAVTPPQPARPAEPQPQPQEPKQDAIPPWRLREEAEARRAAEARVAEYERRLREFESSRQAEVKPPPDIFENPQAFVDYGVKSAVDPVKQEIGQLREFYSQRDAIREHGAEKVKAAYDAVAQGMQSRDPEVMAIYSRAMSSLDPYGEIVKWHQQKTVFSQIGPDPQAWFEKQLEERMKDQAFQAKLIERTRSQLAPRPAPVTQLPPSLNRATSSAPSDDDGEDLSDAGLLKSALRR